MKYRTHGKVVGWSDWSEPGKISGSYGQAIPLEALEVDSSDLDGVGVKYQVYMSKSGWLPEQTKGQIGIAGENIEVVRFDLYGPNKDLYDIFYQVHVQDYGWMNWAKNGEQTGANGENKQVEAIIIRLVEKGSQDIVKVDNTNSFLEVRTPVPQPVQPQPQVTEDQLRANLVAVAQSHIGETEGFGRFFGDPYGEWCAYFDMRCCDEAGVGSIIPRCGNVGDACDQLLAGENTYLFLRGNYTPRNGDLIYFDYNRNNSPDHTGIVEGCDGETVCTIEGNTGDPRQVKRKYYDINSLDIYAYGVMDWGSLIG